MNQQLNLTFEPSLITRNQSLRQLMAGITYGEAGLTRMAGIMDVAPSNLSQMLSGQQRLDTDKVEAYIQKTGDQRPALFMAAKYLQDSSQVQQQALSQLSALLPQIQQLLETAGQGGK